MNEGCAGGWPEFNGWFYESGHLVSEDCAPYNAKSGSCKNYANCQAQAKIKKSYHVGGGYGKVSEVQMMKEILMNGALNVEYLGSGYLDFYNQGIISEKNKNMLAQLIVQNLLLIEN